MFGTLKAGKKANSGSMVFVEQNKHIRSTYGIPHIACIVCRDRKLKCTGEPAGCKRCRGARSKCEYPPACDDKRGKAVTRRPTQEPRTPARDIPAAKSSSPAIRSPGSRDSKTAASWKSAKQPPPPPLSSPKTWHDSTTPDFDFSIPIADISNPQAFDDMVFVGNATALDPFPVGHLGIDDPDIMAILTGIARDHQLSPGLSFDHTLFPTLPGSSLGSTSSSSSSSSSSVGMPETESDKSSLSQPTPQWPPRATIPQHSASQSSGSGVASNASGDFMSQMEWSSSSATSSLSSSSISSSQNSSRSNSRGPSVKTTSSQQVQAQIFSSPKLSSSSSSSSSGSDSDSECRCSERALRLLEKIPDASSDTELSEGSTPLAQAAAGFLGDFSRHVALFSSISSCNNCTNESSFCMAMLMVAQRLTSRLNSLLSRTAATSDNSNNIDTGPAEPDNSAAQDIDDSKFTLTLPGHHAIEYDEPLQLLATLLAGKVCRLASCVFAIRALCVSNCWAPYARGFDEVEASLRERMSDLEIMM